MNVKHIVLFAVIIAVLAGTFFLGRSFGQDKSPSSAPIRGESIAFDSAVGSKAPEFELGTIDGTKVRLSELAGKKVVLFFTEGAMCYPSCWNQISALSTDKRLNNEKVISYSIVVDSPAEWKKIMQKYPKMSGSKLLFDTRRQASVDYDVLYVDSSMHKGGYPGHTYFIIDENGIIKYTLDDPKMGIRNEQLVSEISKMQ